MTYIILFIFSYFSQFLDRRSIKSLSGNICRSSFLQITEKGFSLHCATEWMDVFLRMWYLSPLVMPNILMKPNLKRSPYSVEFTVCSWWKQLVFYWQTSEDLLMGRSQIFQISKTVHAEKLQSMFRRDVLLPRWFCGCHIMFFDIIWQPLSKDSKVWVLFPDVWGQRILSILQMSYVDHLVIIFLSDQLNAVVSSKSGLPISFSTIPWYHGTYIISQKYYICGSKKCPEKIQRTFFHLLSERKLF